MTRRGYKPQEFLQYAPPPFFHSCVPYSGTVCTFSARLEKTLSTLVKTLSTLENSLSTLDFPEIGTVCDI